MTGTDINRTIDAVWRIEQARLIAGLARIVRDVGVAEELAQDALVSALKQWPEQGIPRKPGAWLMAAAKNRAFDRHRRQKMLSRKHRQIAYELEDEQAEAPIWTQHSTIISVTACSASSSRLAIPSCRRMHGLR